MKILLPLFYLPPTSWFSVFLRENAEIVFDQFESFPKQTYRNRTAVYGANGRLLLIIPVKHNGTRTINEIEVSHRDGWEKIHWKSIKTAYQRSPYFEYYEDQLEQIFNFKTNSLFAFNLNALKIIQKILKTDKGYSLTEEYIRNPTEENYREKFSPKKEQEFILEEYYQTFTEKFGFQEDLSIIDLLCNKGPESLTYIKNIQNK